jgi:hypothetical protein
LSNDYRIYKSLKELLPIYRAIVAIKSKGSASANMVSLIVRMDEIVATFHKFTLGASEAERTAIEDNNRPFLVQKLLAELDSKDKGTARDFYSAMGIDTLEVTEEDIAAFREMRLMDRPEWVLTYTVDFQGTFPQVRWGRTPHRERMYTQGIWEVFDRLACRASRLRQSTGRFFLSEKGVFYKENNKFALQCLLVRFEMP